MLSPAPLAPMSEVCLIAKNEGSYLLEWIAYHRALGFDRIVVYENVSSDNSAALLEEIAAAELIDYRPWHAGASESSRISTYRDALVKTKAEWILFINADEFLVLHQHENVNSIAAFDDKPDVTTIGGNWRTLGDFHLSEPDGRLLIDRFNRAAEPCFAGNRYLKKAQGYADRTDDSPLKYSPYDDERFNANNRNEFLDERAHNIFTLH